MLAVTGLRLFLLCVASAQWCSKSGRSKILLLFFFFFFPFSLSLFPCLPLCLFNTKYMVVSPFRVELEFWKVEEETLGDWTWKGRVEEGSVGWMRV